MLFSRPYRLARLGRGDRIVMRVCLALLLAVLSLPAAAIHCEGADHVRLKHPVELAPALRAEIRALAPLKILALDSPPIAKYNAEQRRYQGIAIDILCFLSEELGMKFEIAPHDESLSVAEQVRYVQEGKADVFLPISYSSSRAERGVFTADFYSSYYAVIARRGANVVVRSFNDLANYQVGYVNGFSLESMLRAQVPADQLSSYSQWTSNGLFDALQDGRIDVALFSQQVFTEKRYASELFDLEIIHVLYDFPRAYRFYFSPSSEHERLVAAIDMYLSAMDLSASFKAHQEGERSLVERYVAQRNQSTVLRTASVAAAALALIAFLAMLRHRRLTRLLKEQNAYIEHQRHALVEANKKLEILSQTDPLTELPNRRSFDERAVREYTRYLNTDTPLSVLIIDVDHFKSVNDDFGHATGDLYLRTIAHVIDKLANRGPNMAARYGGEEFTCLLPATANAEANDLAEQIRQEVERLRLPGPDETSASITVSIGAATVEGGDPGIQTLLMKADAQLYIAKTSGRNQVRSCTLAI